jgi:NADH:ubiquinone oxidoreductase subunit 3 (subunit A)
MQLLMDLPPKRDMGWLTFLLMMLVLAALGAGAGYAAFRFGLLRWMGL